MSIVIPFLFPKGKPAPTSGSDAFLSNHGKQVLICANIKK